MPGHAVRPAGTLPQLMSTQVRLVPPNLPLLLAACILASQSCAPHFGHPCQTRRWPLLLPACKLHAVVNTCVLSFPLPARQAACAAFPANTTCFPHLHLPRRRPACSVCRPQSHAYPRLPSQRRTVACLGALHAAMAAVGRQQRQLAALFALMMVRCGLSNTFAVRPQCGRAPIDTYTPTLIMTSVGAFAHLPSEFNSLCLCCAVLTSMSMQTCHP